VWNFSDLIGLSWEECYSVPMTGEDQGDHNGHQGHYGFLIPAGVLIGLGVGLLVNQVGSGILVPGRARAWIPCNGIHPAREEIPRGG